MSSVRSGNVVDRRGGAGNVRRWRTLLVAGSMAASLALVASPSVSKAAATALHFDGVNDYVTFGNASTNPPSAELGLSTFTIETWFIRDGTGIATTTSGGSDGFVGSDGIIPLVAKGRGEGESPANINMNYILGITTGAPGARIGADFEEAGGANHKVIGVTPIVNGVWYHAAATYDGSNLRIYLNGVEEASVPSATGPSSTSIQHASLGSALTSTGVAGGYFAGSIDEARIWNYARSRSRHRCGDVDGDHDESGWSRRSLGPRGRCSRRRRRFDRSQHERHADQWADLGQWIQLRPAGRQSRSVLGRIQWYEHANPSARRSGARYRDVHGRSVGQARCGRTDCEHGNSRI